MPVDTQTFQEILEGIDRLDIQQLRIAQERMTTRWRAEFGAFLDECEEAAARLTDTESAQIACEIEQAVQEARQRHA